MNLSTRTILVFALALLLISCEGDEFVRYRINAVGLDHLSSANGQPAIHTEDSAAQATYGLRIHLFTSETQRKGRYFDPYESSVSADNPIQHFFITSDKSMDAAHPPGIILNSFFYYFPGNYFYTEELDDSTMIELKANYYPTYPAENIPNRIDLLLQDQDILPGARKFYVRLEFVDGSVLNDSTKTILLY